MHRAILVCLALGCGGANKKHQGLEPPPPYTPENAPEPATACPEEAEAARAAREQAIGEESAQLGDEAAKAAFVHAECERRLFDAVFVGSGADPSVVHDLKTHFQSAKNLYGESMNYQVPRWVIGAHTRIGDLHVSFADKVRLLSTPPGASTSSSDPDVAAMDERLKLESGKSYRAALDAAELWPKLAEEDVDVAAWIATACKGVDLWQPGSSQRYRVCAR